LACKAKIASPCPISGVGTVTVRLISSQDELFGKAEAPEYWKESWRLEFGSFRGTPN